MFKSSTLASAFGLALAANQIGSIDRFNVITSPLMMPSFRPAKLRASKVRGRRMQRTRIGNPPGKYAPHQGAREMARRVRQMMRGDLL